MKIGFIFPNKDRRYKTIHLGLGYLASYAREHHKDLEFFVLDTRIATKRETNSFFNIDFDLVGMTVFSPVYSEVISVFDRVKKKNKNTPICLGGPYVTTIREEIFKETPAEFAILGEGEETFSELLSYLKGDGAVEDINGLIYKNADAEYITNSSREKIENLNSLPIPAYDIFQMDRYPLHRIVTSRGCPYACAWCNSSSIWDKTYRMVNAEYIVKEIDFLVKNYGKKIFIFGDNSFNIDLKRVGEFCDLLLEKKIDILWSVSLRADIMTQEIAYKMREAGCYNVAIGIESANNDILLKMGKETTIEKMTVGIKMLKKAGIEIMSQFVMGSPYETLDTIKESIEYAKTSGCDYTNFYAVLPFKGTPQWDYIAKKGSFLTKTIHDFHTINPRVVFETKEFSQEDRLEAIKLVTKEGFYSNKDKRNWFFDFAKETSRKIQTILPKSMGEKAYLVLKSIYKMKMIKKNNL